MTERVRDLMNRCGYLQEGTVTLMVRPQRKYSCQRMG